jgi:hypothetical protein
MFTGWKHTNDALIRGAKTLARKGPSTDMYHNYYATQVLFHLKTQLPQEWQAWRSALESSLLSAQNTEGHQAGSYFKGLERGHAAEIGGVFYITSMCTMTLQCYFKHGSPLYQKEATADDFVE